MTSATGRLAAVPRRGLASFVLTIIGIGISIYLTIEHFSSSTSFACPENATINCVKVTTSEYSRFLGMPVAVLGLAYFVGMAVLCSPWLWQMRRLDPLRVVGGVGGTLMVLYLLWAELFKIDAICLWCTAVHVCTVVLLGAILWTVNSHR